MTSALTRAFGLRNLPLVEDAVHDALCRALETWKFSGVPENPGAWLMRAAKNRALDLLRRERTARAHAPEMAADAHADAEAEAGADAGRLADDEQAVADAELRMMFACCHARLAPEVQVALVLNLLGGFGAREIASAFFVSEAAMEKRLVRGKETLRAAGKLPDVTRERVAESLAAVHGALYLLFNEGYHGAHRVETVRVEICAEAIRLTALLAAAKGASPETHALLALMCLVGARVGGRVDAAGELVPLASQDRSRWDAALVARGVAELEASATGDVLTAFHLEAAIAYEHAVAASHATTRWDRIAAHYDLLMRVRPSPVVALSRAIAIGEVEGPERALEEIARIEHAERLAAYPFHAAAIAEQELRAGRPDRARPHFERARSLARSPAEEAFFARRLATLA